MRLFKHSEPTPTVEQFYEQNKAAIKAIIAKEEQSRTSIKDLKYEITSKSTGHSYYSFPQQMALPFERVAKNMEYFEWLQNGISPAEFDLLYSQIQIQLAHISAAKNKDAEAVKKLGTLIYELQTRRQKALPYYVLINLAANNLIREDEDPQVVSSQIHHQKCDDLQNEIETGSNAFFLTLPQLKILSEMQNMSSDELTLFLQKLQSEATQSLFRVKAFTSWKDASKDVTTF